jgi:hypothetical protein
MVRKRIVSTVMSLMMAATVLTTVPTTNNVKAAEATQGDYTYQVETQAGKQYITLTDYKGKEEKITLPEEINGIEVTFVQAGFGKNSNLKSITFSKNMQKNLAAFSDISTLEEIQASKDNTAYQTEDGILYTKGKKELLVYPKSKKTETYIMPSEVEKIDDYNYVLTHLKYLKNLIFSKNLKTIPECSESSMESVVIPDQVKRIEESTFLGCENLKKVTFGKNVTFIGDGAFAQCKALKTIKLPKNLKEIDDVAFVATSLKEVTIPNSVVKIGRTAFDKNVKLKKPAYLKKIKDGSVVYYEARATVKASGKKAVTYKASKITKIKAKTSKVTIKKGKTAKLQTRVYISKKLKKGYLDPEILKFTTSNKKVAKVSSKGTIKGLKKGKATITVKLRTTGKTYKVNVKVK